MAPTTGMMTSPTSEVTMAPNATPMWTPTERSTTLPFMANPRNPLSISSPSLQLREPEDPWRQREGLVDQTRMHHGAAHRHARRLGHRHHRQAQALLPFSTARTR